MKWSSRELALCGLIIGAGCGFELPNADEADPGNTVIFQGLNGAMAPTRGLVWERDEGFLLSGHTVPTVLSLDPGFLLFASAPERGRISIHQSMDGLAWESRGFLDLSGLPVQCSRTVLDVSVQHTDGGYRVVVETWERSSGLMDPSGQARPQEESPTVFCALESSDAQNWTPVEQPLQWPGLSRSWPSGLEFLGPESSGLFYYVDTYPDLDGIRTGVFNQGQFRTEGERKTLLPEAHVDPLPVALEGGGVRLYHSRALEGILAVSDSKDGRNFGESRPLQGLSGQVCHAPPERPSPPDACFLDPSLLRTSDGRSVLYFSVFESLRGGEERRGIGRAFAVD